MSDNTNGREANAAEPLGERKGTSSKADTRVTGKAEQDTAGPDGPKVESITKTIKR